MKIQNKVLVFTIAVCLFSLLSMSAATYFTVSNLAGYSREVNTELGKGSAQGAGDALLEQAHNFLLSVTRAQSRSCDNMLDSIKFDVLMLESNVRAIFNNPHEHSYDSTAIKLSESAMGVYEYTYSLPKNVPLTTEIQNELDLLGDLNHMMSILAENPNINELFIGMESGLFYNYTKLAFDAPEYDPRTRPWYINAAEHPDDVVFTDFFEGAFGTGMIISAAKAIYDDEGKLLGVAALNILLKDLKELIVSTHITNSGYAFILNSEGKYIVHPDMGSDGFDQFLPKVKAETGTEFAQGYIKMMNGEEGFVSGEVNGKNAFLTFSPISVADWSIGIIIYEEELLSSIETLIDQIDALTTKSEENITRVSGRAISVFIAIFFIVAIMVTALAISLSHLISRPIKKLAAEVIKVGNGNFVYRIPVESHDEIGFLTEAFNNMADNMCSYTKSIIQLNFAKSQLEADANTDALTGIFNRRHFMRVAAMENNAALRAGKNNFIIIFDLDHFKRINDTYGHPAGDATLKEMAEVVMRLIRAGDLFARYGGEEFILLVSDIAEAEVRELVERIRISICSHSIKLDGSDITVTASFGVAAASPENELDAAISLADEALYKAKNEGRNKTVFYTVLR